MPTRARSLRRGPATGTARSTAAAPGGAGRVIARRPIGSVRAVKQPSGFGDGVLASAEQEATQASFVRGRLATPWALFMVGALGYAVYQIVAAMFTAR